MDTEYLNTHLQGDWLRWQRYVCSFFLSSTEDPCPVALLEAPTTAGLDPTKVRLTATVTAISLGSKRNWALLVLPQAITYGVDGSLISVNVGQKLGMENSFGYSSLVNKTEVKTIVLTQVEKCAILIHSSPFNEDSALDLAIENWRLSSDEAEGFTFGSTPTPVAYRVKFERQLLANDQPLLTAVGPLTIVETVREPVASIPSIDLNLVPIFGSITY